MIRPLIFDSDKLFAVSDIHGFHSNLCVGTSKWNSKSGCRPFKDPIEMTNKIVDNINEVVPEDATLLHLGDFLFGNKQRIYELRHRIICKNIIHLYGNHDDYMINDQGIDQLFCHTGDYLEFSIQYKDVRQKCVAMHYPIISWRDQGRGSWMLYGHCHGNLKFSAGKMLDVGLETNNYYPYSCKQLREILDKIPVNIRDHHQ